MRLVIFAFFAILGVSPLFSADDFALECTVQGDVIVASLRNVSDHEIKVSDYTLGYHEAVVVERYDEVARSWTRVPLSAQSYRALKSAGASPRNVKSVAPGAIIFAGAHETKSAAVSFSVNLKDYALPAGNHLIRVTQVMGAALGSDLPVWKGSVVSGSVQYQAVAALQ